jgi:hypothetical protein
MVPVVMSVMMMPVMLVMAMMTGGAGIRREIKENRCKQCEKDKVFHNFGFNSN